MKHPAIEGAVIDGKSPFAPHFLNVSVIQEVCQVPPHAFEDHVALNMLPFERDGSHHALPQNGS